MEIAPRPRPIVRATELGTVTVLKDGPLMLLSDAYGDIRPDRRGLGLYRGDTRLLSTALLLIEGRTPTVLRPDPGGTGDGVIQLSNPELPNDPTRAVDHPIALPRQSVGILRTRRLSGGAFRERLTLTNYTMTAQRLTLTLQLDADGADIFEVRGHRRPRRGTLAPVRVGSSGVRFVYRGLDGRDLVTEVSFDEPPTRIGEAPSEDPAAVAAHWSLSLPPAATRELAWAATGGWSPRAGPDAVPPGSPAAVPPGSPADTGRSTGRRPTSDAVSAGAGGAQDALGATIETDDEILNLIIGRAVADLTLLRTPGPADGERFVAAGVPWFATLFGRDSLIAGYGALPYLPGLARDALTVLARLQATDDEPERDAEPGKILHEMRTGEMAATGELPFARYYGSVDSTPLWLMLLSESTAWTGDRALVDRLWPAALAALGWLERSPRDEDGFLVYRTRAARGLRNQGWKDSADAIRDRDGHPIDPPTAVAEVQAYAIDARRRLAVLARDRGDPDLAASLESAAAALAARFDERFWIPDVERYAMALGAGGAVADALASNMGHCLWAGAIPDGRAALVAGALRSPALFSGWGVRTYADGQPGFNPLGYHTGSVWPHDTAIAAAGLKRYGFHDDATAVAWGILDAARRTPGFRLPEHFCGFSRDSIGVPVAHPVSCAPQAWAAASVLLLMTTMLGLVPSAPTGELEIVRPVLPPGLTKVVVRGLPVGAATVDVLFHRWRGTTSAEVFSRTGDLRVTVRL